MPEGKDLYDSFCEEIKKTVPTVRPQHMLLVFYDSIKAFEEATKCFDSGAYEATVSMCRATVDNAVYSAISSGKNIQKPHLILEACLDDVRTFSWIRVRKIMPTDRSGENYDYDSNDKVIVGADITDQFDGDVGYGTLKNNAIKLGIINEQEADRIKTQIREKGNFGVHSAQRRQQDKKFQTSPTEAATTLEETKKYLALIIQRYYS